jgi:hypothetical protein
MSTQTVLYALIGVAVVGLLIYRNLVARPVRGASQRIWLILGILGIVQTVQYFQHNHVKATIGIAALAGSLVLAAVFAVLRAATTRVWMKDGQPWSQGNILTGILWIVALGAHLGYDALIGTHKGISGLGSATVLLYLVVSLGIQRFIVASRAAKLDPAGAGQSPQPGWMG